MGDGGSDDQDVAAIQTAIDAGITHIDTAESYGNGKAEELLGRAIKGRDRSKLIIASKVSGYHQSYEGVHQSLQASLKRLGADYLDLYLLHRYPMAGIDIAETMRAMDELVDKGLVKNIGVCNLTPARFDEAQKHSQHKLVCNQVHYNTQIREVEEKGVLRHAQKNDVLLVAWRPLQLGVLPQSPLLSELAQKYSKTPTQVAINWLLSQDNVVTISKTSNPDHLRENLGAIGWTMDKEDVERIRRDFPNQKDVSDAISLDYPGSDGN
jgi:diketogulonate reductase-like aldo/keto reductase